LLDGAVVLAARLNKISAGRSPPFAQAFKVPEAEKLPSSEDFY
jgi:hypothetical protein